MLIWLYSDSWNEQYATAGVSGAVTQTWKCSGLVRRHEVVSVPSEGIVMNQTVVSLNTYGIHLMHDEFYTFKQCKMYSDFSIFPFELAFYLISTRVLGREELDRERYVITSSSFQIAYTVLEWWTDWGRMAMAVLTS